MATISSSLISFSDILNKSVYPTEREVIESLSYFIQDRIKENNEKDQNYSDPEYQSFEGWATTNIVKSSLQNDIPSSREIYSFIYDLSLFAKLSSECLVVSYIYMTRYLKASKIILSNSNWKEIVILSACLSQKVCYRSHLDVYDFSLFAPQLDPTDLSYKEFEFLQSFNYEYKINLRTFEVDFCNLLEIHHSHNYCIWLYDTKIVETAIKRSEWMTPETDDGDLRKFVSISQSSLSLEELEDS